MGFQPKQYSKGLFVLLVGKVVLLCTLSVAAANTRLAIGSFGLASEKADGELADLIAVKLSATPELELVERRETALQNAVCEAAERFLPALTK